MGGISPSATFFPEVNRQPENHEKSRYLQRQLESESAGPMAWLDLGKNNDHLRRAVDRLGK